MLPEPSADQRAAAAACRAYAERSHEFERMRTSLLPMANNAGALGGILSLCAGLPQFRYRECDPSDPRAWLDTLPRGDARVRSRELHAAYVAALPAGALPVSAKAFVPVAEAALGPRIKSGGDWYYRGLAPL